MPAQTVLHACTTLAAIWIHGTVPELKQMAICLEAIEQLKYQMSAYLPLGSPPEAVAEAVSAGLAEVVVVAYGGAALARPVTEAGGRVESMRPVHHVVEPPPARRLAGLFDLAAGWYKRGRTVPEIAELLDVTTGDIREYLRLSGVRQSPPRSRRPQSK